MIPTTPRTAVKVLLVLASLWSLQGCAEVSTRSRPVELDRPPETEAPSPSGTEALNEIEPLVSVTPEAVPDEAKAPASLGPEEAHPGADPPVSAKPDEPPPEPAVPDGPEAPARVASLVPAPREARARPEPPPMASEPATHVHVVRWKGETLSLIAQWYTASWQNWEVLARANPGIDPDRIAIGNRIQIPERLVRKRAPLPFDFLPPSTGRTGPKRGTGQPGTGTEEVLLFGPAEATATRGPAPEAIELFAPAEIAGQGTEISEETGLFGPLE